ncbi:MAG: SDR family NAD(P)-dependent oxidoreductase, partial [Alphaproteobacteria bacterium]|nr:SDR family NAD(P)-dependent oxidoreductase [Alphaproteobacteria bacterium]
FTAANPRLELDDSPFFVPARATPWPNDGKPRIAGVSSFGFGGTNAHVILRAWEPPAPTRSTGPQLIRMSAATRRGVDDLARDLAAAIDDGAGSLTDIAATLGTGRRSFPYRRAVVAETPAEARASLTAAAGAEIGPATTGMRRVFMFTGQGAQYAGMARGLYDGSKRFRDTIDRCVATLLPELGVDLRSLIFAPPDRAETANGELRRTRLTQPALFAVEYALAQWWAELGVEPDAMIGHSVGEYVAACCAGVFDLDAALRLVAARGRLMDGMPAGSMLAVPLAADAIVRPDGIELAAVNAPELTVLAGPTSAIEAFAASLEARGIKAQRLRTSHAFHSAAMDGALLPFRRAVAAVERRAPARRFVSNLTGDWITEAQATSDSYWVEQLRGTVRFSDGLTTILRDGAAALIEVGPGSTLTTLARTHLPANQRHHAVATLRRHDETVDDLRHALAAAGRLWMLGVPLEPGGAGADRRPPVSLPTYPFERKLYSVAADLASAAAATVLRKRSDPSSWTYRPGWTSHPLPLSSPAAETAARGAWIIFSDDRGIGTRLAALIAAMPAAGPIAVVERGARFERLATGRYRLPPADAAGLAALLDDMAGPEDAPTHVAFLWGLAPIPAPAAGLSDRLVQIDDALDSGFFTLFELGRLLGKRGGGGARLTVVATGAASLLGNEPVDATRTTMLALCRVLQAEAENLAARLVDIDATTLTSTAEAARLVVEECLAEDAAPYVARRGASRWMFAPVPAPLPAVQGLPSRLRRGGTYLITGGLGGIGLTLARHLAGIGAKLVLTGRRDVPARETWATASAATGMDAATVALVRELSEIESLGATVLVVKADVADPAGAAAMLDAGRARFGRIDGIIHAAGLAGGGVIELQSAARIRDVMAAKVAGAIALIELTRQDPPDFTLLCSSLTAVVGSAGRLDYTAANLFMDALAEAAHRDGRHDVVSVAWDLWVAKGMALEVKAKAAGSGAVGDVGEGLEEAEALEIFGRVLSQRVPNIVVSVRELPAMLRLSERGGTPPAAPATGSDDDAGSGGDGRERLTATFAAPATDQERSLVEAWQQVLGFTPIGVNDDFFELGGDSLLALRLAGRLRPILRYEIGPRLILENPTIAALCRAIAPKESAPPAAERAAALRSRIDAMSPEEIRALLAKKAAGRTER